MFSKFLFKTMPLQFGLIILQRMQEIQGVPWLYTKYSQLCTIFIVTKYKRLHNDKIDKYFHVNSCSKLWLSHKLHMHLFRLSISNKIEEKRRNGRTEKKFSFYSYTLEHTLYRLIFQNSFLSCPDTPVGKSFRRCSSRGVCPSPFLRDLLCVFCYMYIFRTLI